MIVLHYTGMPDAEGALDRLTSPEAKVSCHYLIDEDGAIYRLVDEAQRAWHAGKSRWRGITDVNSASVGIEIVNPGHEFGYRSFPDEQIASLIPLVADIKERHGIGRGNVVGHSDVAPGRKEDPGELFPWHALAKRRLALPSPTRDLIDPYWTDAGFLLPAAAAAIQLTSTVSAAPVLAPPPQLSVDVQQYVKVPAGRVALTHVRVIDGTGGAPTEDQTILIDGPHIAAVQPASAAVPQRYTVLDLTGATVIPGIVGMHDHLFYLQRPNIDPSGHFDNPIIVPQMTFSAPRLYLANGVPTMRTTGSFGP